VAALNRKECETCPFPFLMCDTVRDNFFCSEKWLRLLSVSDLPSAVAESPSWQPTARRTSPTRKEEAERAFFRKSPRNMLPTRTAAEEKNTTRLRRTARRLRIFRTRSSRAADELQHPVRRPLPCHASLALNHPPRPRPHLHAAATGGEASRGLGEL
jgi:hypothetical protein